MAITPAHLIDLSISKSDGVTDVTTGAALAYTLVVANAGPTAADGAVLRDPPVPGLLKTGTPICSSPVGGAVCPTATLTNANLEGANGVVIPTLPAGGSLTFSIFATVQGAQQVSASRRFNLPSSSSGGCHFLSWGQPSSDPSFRRQFGDAWRTAESTLQRSA